MFKGIDKIRPLWIWSAVAALVAVAAGILVWVFMMRHRLTDDE